MLGGQLLYLWVRLDPGSESAHIKPWISELRGEVCNESAKVIQASLCTESLVVNGTNLGKS